MLRCVLHSCVRPVNFCSCVLLFTMPRPRTPSSAPCAQTCTRSRARSDASSLLRRRSSEPQYLDTHVPVTDTLAEQLLMAAIAQLGERQTEDLKVPSSILGLGMFPPAPAPRVGLGGRNLSCGGGQGGCKACVFADPAACPLHPAPCYLGPRQRAGARRGGGGEPPRRHARWTPQASAWAERATAGGAFRARRAQSHKAAAYWIA